MDTNTVKWQRNSTISLIEQVREFPCIWDIECPNFRKKGLKRAALEQVCANLKNDFPASLLQLTAELVKAKYGHIRSYFQKEVKKIEKTPSGAGGGEVSKWEFFEYCQYMQPTGSLYRRNSNLKLKPKVGNREFRQDSSPGFENFDDFEEELNAVGTSDSWTSPEGSFSSRPPSRQLAAGKDSISSRRKRDSNGFYVSPSSSNPSLKVSSQRNGFYVSPSSSNPSLKASSQQLYASGKKPTSKRKKRDSNGHVSSPPTPSQRYSPAPSPSNPSSKAPSRYLFASGKKPATKNKKRDPTSVYETAFEEMKGILEEQKMSNAGEGQILGYVYEGYKRFFNNQSKDYFPRVMESVFEVSREVVREIMEKCDRERREKRRGRQQDDQVHDQEEAGCSNNQVYDHDYL